MIDLSHFNSLFIIKTLHDLVNIQCKPDLWEIFLLFWQHVSVVNLKSLYLAALS